MNYLFVMVWRPVGETIEKTSLEEKKSVDNLNNFSLGTMYFRGFESQC